MNEQELQKLKLDLMGGITDRKPGWYHSGLTMIGSKRMDSLETLTRKVLADNVPGDFCETGVWRGGACIFMRAILETWEITDRYVWVCDSFEGVPVPDEKNYPADAGNNLNAFDVLAVSLEEVKENFKKAGLDSQVVFVKGRFRDTMPTIQIKKLALLRLDGDLYESTIQVLDALYPKLSEGGAIIIDDYGDMPSCRKAVDDYRERHNITEPMVLTDDSEIYWIKGLYNLDIVKKPKIVAIIPTWSNFPYLVRAIESIRDYTLDAEVRFVVIDNGSTDNTPEYLADLKKADVDITIITNKENVGFVKATNQGLREVREGEIIALCNDDIQIVDPYTFARLAKDLDNPSVGMVVPTSDYVMWLQKCDLSFQITRKRHETGVVVYFCGLWRYDVFKKVGFLDERFGAGGNDDMDLSIRIKGAGYKLIIDRDVFVKHYGSRTLLRNNDVAGYDRINQTTRKILIDKWGEKKVDDLFRLPDFMLYRAEYYASISNYGRTERWLNEWKRIADKIVETLHPTSVLDAGCAHGMLVEALWDKRSPKFVVNGVDVSDFALSQAREDIKPFLRLCSLTELDKALGEIRVVLRYDLAVCIEVLEHLTEKDGKLAIKNLCERAGRILFSSTPDDATEPTHQNVQPKEYWDSLFKEHGFVPDKNYDASWLTKWATLYMKEA